MQESEFIWFNGKFVPWADAKIHVLSHGLHYGSGAFEGIRFYNTNKGVGIFRLPEHVKRLFYSATSLKMQLSYSENDVCEAIKTLLQKNKLQEGYVRPIVFYGYEKLGVSPFGNPVDFAIACWPWGAYLPSGVKIKTSQYIRIHPDCTNVNAKLTGNYINGVLASIEIAGTEFHEALFLDAQGYISEGVGENFFIVKDNVIYTPKLGTILPGITRDTVMCLLQEADIQCVEKDIRLDEALAADEAFFTGTAAEISWIHSIDHKVIGHGAMGKITKQLYDRFHQIIRGEDSKGYKFLTYI